LNNATKAIAGIYLWHTNGPDMYHLFGLYWYSHHELFICWMFVRYRIDFNSL